MTAKAPKNQKNQPTPSPPVRRKIVLTKIGHVRAELSRLYSEARHGDIAISDASRLAYLLATIAKVIQDGDIEQRLDAVEKLLQQEGNK